MVTYKSIFLKPNYRSSSCDHFNEFPWWLITTALTVLYQFMLVFVAVAVSNYLCVIFRHLSFMAIARPR